MSVASATCKINGEIPPRLRPELQLLHCMMLHGCRTDDVSSEMLTGINGTILDAIADVVAANLTATPANVSAMLARVPTVDSGAINSTLDVIASETSNPHMFDVYCREIIDRAERDRLIAHYSEGLSLCRSGASVTDLREHASTLTIASEHQQQSIQFVDGAALAAMDTRITFAVDDIIVQGQPLLLVGPKKTLKTNVSIDLTISLATGLHFLGQYRIPKPIRAGLMSAESGAATIKETAHRVAISKGLNGVQDCEDALFAFDTPLVSTAKQCDQFRRIIEDNGLEFLNIDPTYLTFAIGDEGKNIFRMGELLAPLSRIGQQTGCTICLSHHARKGTGKDGNPLDLGDESFSGFSEWCRQWLYLSRREAYDETRTGSHKLWMRWGGSAGHSGLIGLDVDEGSRKDQWGRRWDLRVVDAGEIITERLTADEDQRQAKQEATFEKHLQQTRDALTAFPDGGTMNDIASKARLSKTNCQAALFELESTGDAQQCTVEKNKRTFDGWAPGQRDK